MFSRNAIFWPKLQKSCKIVFKMFHFTVQLLRASEWGSVTYQMAVPVPSISCFFNYHNLFYRIHNALAFNRDMCCQLALCLKLLPFHWSTSWAFHSIGGFLSLTTNKSLGLKDLQGTILNLSVALLTIKKLYDIATWSISKISVDDLPNLSSLRYWRRGKIS